MKRKKAAVSNTDDDEDIPLKTLVCINLKKLDTESIVPDKVEELQEPGPSIASNPDELLEYSMETCKYCQAIFHTRYDHYLHLVQHLIIKVEPTNFIKCDKCKVTLESQESLNHHNCAKNKLGNVNCKKLIVKVENFGDLVKKLEQKSAPSQGPVTNGVKIEESTKEKTIDNESEIYKARMKLIDDIRSDILRSFVTKNPVVKCDDIAQIVKINTTDKKDSKTNGKTFFNDAAVITKVNSVDKKPNGFTRKTKKSENYVKNGNDYDFDASTNTVNLIDDDDDNTINLIDDDTDSDTNEKMILSDLLKSKSGKRPGPKSKKVDDISSIKNEDFVKIESKNYNDTDKPAPKNKKDDLSATKSHTERDEYIKTKRKKYNDIKKTASNVEETKNIDKKEALLPKTNVKKQIINEKDTANLKKDTSSKPKDSEVTELFSCNTINTRCRLIFEDDSDEDIMNLDKAQERNGIDKKLNTATKPLESGLQLSNKIMLGSKPNVYYGSPNEKVVYKSIHFDDLQKPGVYFCRYCSKAFPNKYLLICHEKHHIKIKQRRALTCYICDRYIAGNHHSVRQHIQRCHPGDNIPQKPASQICSKCGLKYYHYSKHLRNYHYIHICNICGRKYETEKERNEHFQEHVASKTFEDNSGSASSQPEEDRKDVHSTYSDQKVSKSGVCEKLECKDSIAPDFDECSTKKICSVCCMFLKNSSKHKYTVVGEYSRVGEKQTCEKCQKSHFAVKIVKTFRRKTEIHYKKVTMAPSAAKLKNIRRRLKKLNAMARL